MNPNIITTKPIVIVGLKANLSFITNGSGTAKLAKQFMPNRNQVLNRIGTEKFSIQVYDQFNYNKMSPNTLFEKWVGVEVSNADRLPGNMEVLTIPSGQYAVFNYKGKPENFLEAWQYIHTIWLPNSEFEIDDRPHFEKLPEDYHPSNPITEEEIWVPVK